MFRCGHRFHKKCIAEKFRLDSDKGQHEEELEIEEEDAPYVVTPTYKPKFIYDKNRERRLETLTQRIEDNAVRNMCDKKY